MHLGAVQRGWVAPEYRRAREMRKSTARVRMLFAEGSPPEGFSLPA
ncbi:hypothetical protein [Nonomuraea sp. LPB2021202275-12-8]